MSQTSAAGTSPLVTPVILCGGSGTRLWPLSSPEKPKQFHRLAHAELSLLQQTALRAMNTGHCSAPIIVGGQASEKMVHDQLQAIGIRPELTILEPCGRNTAGAIAAAVLAVDAERLLWLVPSDHFIGEPEQLADCLQQGLEAAASGWLITFGIVPVRAATEYGYIQRGPVLSGSLRRVARFVEKPAASIARELVCSGDYYWNSGMFLARAGVLADAFARHAPEIWTAVGQAGERSVRQGARWLLHKDAFEAVPSRSFDHAVMEHADKVAVVPLTSDWSDLGNWSALWERGKHTSTGNSLVGPVEAVDCSGSLIQSDGLRVIAVGIKDLIVIATADGVLVRKRNDHG